MKHVTNLIAPISSLLLTVCALQLVWSAQMMELQNADLSKINQSYGNPGKNSHVDGSALTSDETKVKGIGVYGQSRMRLFVDGRAERLSGKITVAPAPGKLSGADIQTVPLADGQFTFYRTQGTGKTFLGIGSNPQEIGNGSMEFRILGDDNVLFNSGIVRPEDGQRAFNIIIPQGTRVLELVTTDGGDGMVGDKGAWVDPVLEYQGESPRVLGATEPVPSTGKSVSGTRPWQQLVKTLPEYKGYYNRVTTDWIIRADRRKAFPAQVYQACGGRHVVLSNGLVSREFRIDPMLATVEFFNHMSGQTILRAVSNEGVVKINGQEYGLGGVDGQFEYGYTQRDWWDQFVPAKNSFRLRNVSFLPVRPRIKWANKRWSGPHDPLTGKHIAFDLEHPDLPGIDVRIHYELYDGLPALSKWMELVNKSGKSFNLDSFKLEQLACVEPDSPVELQKGSPLFKKTNIHIESDWAFRGFTEREADRTEHWVEDPRYTSQCNYPRVTPCLLEVKLPMGPDLEIQPDETWSSFRVWEMPMDTEDRERKGLFIRRLYRTISPWLTENPIFMHCTSSNDQTVKEAIDQCVETGYEMVILSFGSGVNMEDESENNYAKYKALNDYARSKGIELGGYSLLSSRWISDEVDVINPETGKRGGMIFGSSPCLCSDWGYDYFRKIRTFYEKTGMSVFENDGSYPGNVCASTKHAHHRGLADSQWKQREQISGLYQWMCEKGIYTNIPDFGYMHNGGTKTGIGYREVNWSLPRERQLILGRQINYDGTWERLPSMCWTFVPLTQYHGGGAAATLEPLSEHLDAYEAHMMQNYGAGIQACYRGHRLYDTPQTRDCVKNVILWYKKYRDILNSDIIHIRRADGRDFDGFLHVNPDLKHKGLIMLFNPLNHEIERKIEIPLYYTGLSGKASIREQEGPVKVYPMSEDRKITLSVKLPARGYAWYVVE